jgi:UDP-N-acetylglucosamine--N-acetylmuramyl-(pentapeptide) pyrophosphoryl-undecaprenol N-acetylglucosamine transferase
MADPKVKGRAHVVGNPVRPEIRALFDQPYHPPEPGGPIRLLITGGSQGARLLSELTPEAILRLPEDLRARLQVQQQTRKESMDGARRTYANALVKAEVAPFFRDMAGRLAAAHLVIGRAGASTVCELAVAGKPSLLVPLKIAADDHQRFNARLLSDADAAAVALEDELTVDSLAGALNALLRDPAWLSRMAAGARSVARPDAAEKLADLVERTALG